MTRNTLDIITLFSILAATAAAGQGTANADSAPDAQIQSAGPTMDIEVDPIAYALSGYSLHAGLTWDGFRLDLGAFALDAPEAFHGVEGLDVYANGFGAKLDYYPLASLPGFFVGTQLSHGRETITHRETGEASTESHTTVGARIGYRIEITSGFYALPWVGVDVSLSDRKQSVAGVDYDPGRTVFFPTVHIGKSF